MSTFLEATPSVLNAIYHRRAVRAYTAQRPSDAVVRELLEAAVQAPTAMHAEPWAFVIVQDKALLKRLSDHSKSMLLDEVASGTELARDTATKNRLLAMLGDPSFNIFYDAGTLIVICCRQFGGFAAADGWLAAQNLMLAAYAKGLGTCCIGFAVPALNAPDMKLELGIPEHAAAVAPIIVGFPRGPVASVARKSPQVLRWVKPGLASEQPDA